MRVLVRTKASSKPERRRDVANDAALEVVGVRKSYAGHEVLSGVDLAIAPGQVVGLLGPNGAGKTTILSIVAGLLRADAGRIRVNGWDVTSEPLCAQRTIGFAPQSTGVYEPLTVEENLRFFGALGGLKGRALTLRVDRLTDALLLENLRSKQCQHLSGGEKRRVHTAIALIAQPPLVLLDEPTVGADIETRAALITLVQRLVAEGTAVLYTTHYLPELESLQADVVMIDHGHVVAKGTIDQLVAEHGTGELELRFKGPAPSVDDLVGLKTHIDGDRIVVPTSEPAAVAVALLDRLGEDIHRLEDVRILRPSLESVFLNLTGRRLPDTGGIEGAA
jgi:ABC-2 type transport system ATP-binding protein